MPERDEGLSTSNILNTKRRRGTNAKSKSGQPQVPTPNAAADPIPDPPPTPRPPVHDAPRPPSPAESIRLPESDEEEEPLSTEKQPTSKAKKSFAGPRSYPHRLYLPDRPSEGCAADSRHFSASSSLVFTFMIIKNICEDEDGVFESAVIQCCLCAEGKGQKGTYHIAKQTMRSTGTMHSHFRNNHRVWWEEREKADSGTVSSRAATAKPRNAEVSS